ncbi:DNA replication/repair protein RecF [Thalassotalea profundi]|uniref:DNA replication and repair protein RecF n=1 Tax=Thalassotalea profundi TaxID=2036687 RepID=A0ABQ3IZ08_9GAMM|nr:DNA replication/repair protein RecF [Thalassotalea profundi]GHE96319.1 DNA replication and repair protein RecF [Thalassotalea profundi]
MSIVKLTTNNFRNLENVSTTFHSDFNFFIGQNGSGKSSLLESIFFLGHGKSFRTAKIDNVVTFKHTNFIVSVIDSNNKRLGLLRDTATGLSEIKIDGLRHNKFSELAQNIAVQIITPESFKIFFGGPRERRRFVDLGMFHVKHKFSEQWKEFTQVLKQRNACLKNQLIGQQFDYWTNSFCQTCINIASLRNEYLKDLKKELDKWLTILLPEFQNEINVMYLQGWNSKKSLLDILNQNKEREYEKGHSLFGAQRFDVRFQYKGVAIETFLSRGQQKLFLLALTFAQAKLIGQVKRVKPILLIDDIGAELDANSRNAFFQSIKELNCQLFITAIDEQALEPIIPKDNNYYMFHVEHGRISAISK